MIKTIHQIWLKGDPIERYMSFMRSVREKNPSWKYILWTADSLPSDFQCHRATRLITQADIARFELIQRFGGVYLDCDIECFGAIDQLFLEDGLYMMKNTDWDNSPEIALIAATHPNHPFFEDYFKDLNMERASHKLTSPLKTTGNFFVQPILKNHTDCHYIKARGDILVHRSGASWIEKDDEWVSASQRLRENLLSIKSGPEYDRKPKKNHPQKVGYGKRNMGL